jgi:hypothetical protein
MHSPSQAETVTGIERRRRKLRKYNFILVVIIDRVVVLASQSRMVVPGSWI